MRPFFATFAALLAAIAALNWRVDPLGFRTRTPDDVTLPKGYLYPSRGIYDRVLKLRLLERAREGQTFILGSSRTFAWSGPDTLNLAVPNGDAFDYVALLKVAHARGKRPSAVYVELSPWTLNPVCGPSLHVRFKEPELQSYTFGQLTSFTVLSIAVLGLARDELPGQLIDERSTEREGYLADGHFRYRASYLATPVAESSRQAREWSQTRQPKLRCGVDGKALAALCEALATAEGDGSRVEVLAMPWNPASLQALREVGPQPLEDLYDRLAAAFEAQCGRAVKRFDALCPEEDFFDAFHLRPQCFAKVAAQLTRSP